MATIWHHLRTGDWLTRSRVRAYCIILLSFYAIAIAGWVALSHDMIDRNGKPLGTDFSDPYAAGTLALAGKAADAYRPALQHAAEKAVFDQRDVPFYGWHYPPFFFAVAAGVATLPYAWGLFVWLAAGLAAYLAIVRAILPRTETLALALAFPAVFINIGHGQNGFLTTALLGGAMLCLDERANHRKWIAGVLIGLLAYKPQFGVLIPLALIADKRWVTIAAAGATIAVLIVISTAALGVGIWHAFLESTTFSQTIILEQGATGWEKIQSLFSALRAFGFGLQAAYAGQAALGLALGISLFWLWRSEAAFDLKASALATASLLATPYLLDYDLTVLAISIAFFARYCLSRGFQSFEITLLAAAWIVPLLSRSVAGLTSIPLGLIAMIALYAMTLRRAVSDSTNLNLSSATLAQA